MFKFIRSVMTTTTAASAPRVPIPVNGVDYRGKVVLAPMVRSGELPTRLIALKYGADLVWGPETIDKAIVGASRRINPRNSMVEFTRIPSNNNAKANAEPQESIIYRIDPQREKGKLIFQMGTASPKIAVEASKVIAGDVAGIDVNAGCPKPFSTSGGMGAALLQTPDHLGEILEALVSEVGNVWQIGISVKIRILPDQEKTRQLVTRLCKTGIIGLTVHCRTPPMRPRERAIRDQLPMVASICRDAGVACLMNGDVTSRDNGLALMKEYDLNGAMIATSAEANPSCFRTEAEGGLVPWRDMSYEYVKAAIECENKWGNTKFMMNIFIPGKDRTYKHAKLARNYEELCQMLGFEDLVPQAQQVDVIIGRSTEQLENKGYKSPAVQKAMDSNESAKAAGKGGAKVKNNTAPVSNGPGPIRSITSPPLAPKQPEILADIPDQAAVTEGGPVASPLRV